MDFSKNTVLKENYTFLVADGDAGVVSGEHGLYNRDTRFLSRYRWRVEPELQTLLLHSPRPDRLHSHGALLDAHHQLVALERDLELHANGLRERLTLTNDDLERHELALTLEFEADFADLFEARGWHRIERSRIERHVGGDRVRLSYRADDDLEMAVELRFDPAPDALTRDGAGFRLALAPGERRQLSVAVVLANPLEHEAAAIPYERWREDFAALAAPPRHRRVLARAVDDLRALLLFTEDGPVPAAGIPWFVAAFGRDALLTCAMLLPYAPEVAEGTLRYLARHQGTKRDPYHAESAGKIMHELRFGELSRTGRTPFGPYYGSVDATALWLMLLHEVWRQQGDAQLLRELRPHWEAALEWLVGEADGDGDGFLEFSPAAPGQGLTVQSWKDSSDSMSHADGSLAEGALAVSEVQGYAYAAYLGAAAFYRELGETAQADAWETRAGELRRAFHAAFWLEPEGTYAMALDGDKRPLRVHNSDAGQLLWTGIVPDEVAPRLVATLFSDDNWSGWGIRTLGASEARYNPVSYHVGSVWPHDTALIAGGLARYGFGAEVERIREATFDLAASQPDGRLPELVGGYRREPDTPPVPYPVACRPQAWDAAALVYLLTL